MVSFTPILWGLAGPLTVFGVTVPKALFWMALVYVFFTTVVAFWIGRPLIRLSFRNELTNAAFRYALVRLRDAAEAIGFYRGEDAERGQLMTRFAAIIANYRAFVRRTLAFLGWNRSMNQIVEPAPHGRAGSPVVRRRDPLRRRHAVVERVSSRCTTRCRSSEPSTTRSRATGRRSSALTGWSPRMKRQGSYRL